MLISKIRLLCTRLLAALGAFNSARLKRLALENIWLVSGALISILGSLALVRLLTQYLNPSEYGQLALALTITNLINQVVMCGLISGIGRYFSIAKDIARLQEYLSHSYVLLRYATFATFAIGTSLFLGAFFSNHVDWLKLIFITIIFSIISNYNGVFGDIQNAARNRPILVINNSLDTLLKIIFTFLTIIIFGVSSTVIMLAYTMSAIVVLISNKFLLKYAIPVTKISDSKQADTSRNWQQLIWAYAWPFSAWGIFTWAQQASDRWALQLFSTTEDVGLFAVLFQLGYAPIIMFSGLLAGFLTPIFYSRAGDATDKSRNANVHNINQLLSYTLLTLTIIGFLVTWYLRDLIFSILVSPEFRGRSYLLPWFVLAGGLFSTGQMLVLKILSEVRPRIMLTVKISTAVFGVLLNIIGAWLAGINGVAGSIVIFSTIYVVSMFWLTSQSKSALHG